MPSAFRSCGRAGDKLLAETRKNPNSTGDDVLDHYLETRKRQGVALNRPSRRHRNTLRWVGGSSSWGKEKGDTGGTGWELSTAHLLRHNENGRKKVFWRSRD